MQSLEMWLHMSFNFINNACITDSIRHGKLSIVTGMLVLVREWIWDIFERGLEAGGLGAVPPEALGCYYQKFNTY